VAGNWPERELGDRKTFSFIKTPVYFQTYLIQNLNLNFARFLSTKENRRAVYHTIKCAAA
jgi:hypothetical protein